MRDKGKINKANKYILKPQISGDTGIVRTKYKEKFVLGSKKNVLYSGWFIMEVSLRYKAQLNLKNSDFFNF